ncbi:MAG TPA: transcriptional repressor [Deltaproteobacteria bacterium]|nr:transcriptional repressor [Deltaproteobacteria bacterium]
MQRPQKRMTKQRSVILEELSKVRTHPTAYDVYEMVRVRLPRISLGTVYRNLEHLSSSGMIKRLDLGGGQRRFDFVNDDHMHIRCIACGRVDDVVLNQGQGMTTIEEMVGTASGYQVLGCSMEFQGICPRCRTETGRGSGGRSEHHTGTD